MTYEIITDREKALEFVLQQVPMSCTEHYKGLSLVRQGEIIASVLYDQCNGSNAFIHVAAKPGRKWLNRWFLHEVFKYPFVTVGCQRITGPINATNKDAIRFIEHLGFRREAVLERAGKDGQDVLLYVMFREDCRYA